MRNLFRRSVPEPTPVGLPEPEPEPEPAPHEGPTRRTGRGTAVVTWSIDTAEKLIAFTFDDGPVPNCTPLALDALDAADIPATLFLVGQRLEANAALLDGRIDRHEVGNHTWSHKNLSGLDFHAAHAEIQRAHDAIVDILGREPQVFRPPFGHMSSLAFRAADSFGYECVLWSGGVNEREFQDDPDSVVPYLVNSATPGSILLAHDAVADGVEPVFLRRIGTIARQLRDQGYEFVTVSDLLASRDAVAA